MSMVFTSLKSFVVSSSRPDALTLSRICVFAGVISSMISTTFMTRSFVLAFILYLVSGDWRRSWPTLIKNKLIIVSLLLVALPTLGLFYSHANWHNALLYLLKYLRNLYPLLFVPLFVRKETQSKVIIAFLIGVMLSEMIAYLHFFHVINFTNHPHSHWELAGDVQASFIVSYAAFLLANYAVDNKKYRVIVLTCFLICSIDVLFLSLERTGYLVYFALTIFFLYSHLGKRGILISVVTIPLILGLLYLTNARLHHRIDLLTQNIEMYYKKNEKETSIGLRLTFASYSLQIIKQHWLLGVGTGSFKQMFRDANGPLLKRMGKHVHPHNEFLHTAFQFGIIGLLIFLYWFYLQIQLSSTMQKPYIILFRGLILSYILLSLCDTSLHNPAGGIYVIFLSVFLASNMTVTEDKVRLCDVKKKYE